MARLEQAGDRQHASRVQRLSGVIRRPAVSIPRQDKTSKLDAESKRLKAGLEPINLFQILNAAVL